MAIVNGDPGFTQLTKLNVTEVLLEDGNPVIAGDLTLADGAVPQVIGGILTSSGINVDQTTQDVNFDHSINVPSGSVTVGEVLTLSEGIADLVIVDLLKDQMSFSVASDFSQVTGSAIPSFINFGAAQTLNINLDDSTTITANPLTFQLTGTVVAPDVRMFDQFTIRTGGVMTNTSLKVTDNATGLAVRYIPSQSAFEGRDPGLDLISGDNTFFVASNAADTPGNFHLGFVPFLIEENQLIDFELIADSVNLLGTATGIPYIVAEIHDGPPQELSGNVITEETNLHEKFIIVGDGGTDIAVAGNGTRGVSITGDSAHLNIRPDATDTAKFNIINSSGVDRLELAYDDNMNSSALSSVPDLKIDSTTGALDIDSSTTTDITAGTNLSLFATAGTASLETNNGDITIGSITTGGVGIIAADDMDIQSGTTADITAGTNLNLTSTAGTFDITSAGLMTINSAAGVDLTGAAAELTLIPLDTNTAKLALTNDSGTDRLQLFHDDNLNESALVAIGASNPLAISSVGDLSLISSSGTLDISTSGGSDAVTISSAGNININPTIAAIFNLGNNDSVAIIRPAGDDTDPPFSINTSSATNGFELKFHVSDRDPTIPVFSHEPGTLWFKADGIDSASYVNVSPVNGNEWVNTTRNSTLLFGAKTSAKTTTATFLWPGNDARDAAPSNIKIMPVTRDGFLKNFIVRQVGGTGSATLTYTVMVNEVASALTVDIANDVTNAVQDTINRVAVSASDRIGVRLEKSAAVTVTADAIVSTMELQ